jgi:hypothetical protein
MNFKPMLRDLAQVYTLESIKEMCGFASRGHVHDVMNGKQEGVKFELGMSILDAHAQLKRQQKRKMKAKQ